MMPVGCQPAWLDICLDPDQIVLTTVCLLSLSSTNISIKFVLSERELTTTSFISPNVHTLIVDKEIRPQKFYYLLSNFYSLHGDRKSE